MKKSGFSKNINIGVDIEYVNRFEKLDIVSDKIFLERVFTKKELKYCFSKKNKAEHLAGRFSAKESIVKALGGFGLSAIKFSEIEIINDKNGLPKVKLGKKSFSPYDVKVSISHTKDRVFTGAIAILKNAKR